MKKIQEDIKTGNFRQAYLLYGEEIYLKQQYKQNLAKALNPDGDTMNFSHYEGKGIDVKHQSLLLYWIYRFISSCGPVE